MALAATGDGARNARAGVAALLGGLGRAGAGRHRRLGRAQPRAGHRGSGRRQPRDRRGGRAPARPTPTRWRRRRAPPAGAPAVIVSARRIADSVDEKRRLAQQVGRRAGGGRSRIGQLRRRGRGGGDPLDRPARGERHAPTRRCRRCSTAASTRAARSAAGACCAACSAIPARCPRCWRCASGSAECAQVLARAAEAALPACAGRAEAPHDRRRRDPRRARGARGREVHAARAVPEPEDGPGAEDDRLRSPLRARRGGLPLRQGGAALSRSALRVRRVRHRAQPPDGEARARRRAGRRSRRPRADGRLAAGRDAGREAASRACRGRSGSSSATRGPRRSRRRSSWHARRPAAPSWSSATTPSTA